MNRRRMSVYPESFPEGAIWLRPVPAVDSRCAIREANYKTNGLESTTPDTQIATAGTMAFNRRTPCFPAHEVFLRERL